MADHSIITCPEWGARKSREPITTTRAATKIIIHHTAGHHAELDENHNSESYAESVRYARAVQNYHMDVNGWIDSGHNFLVCRNGLILQGRWLTVSAIQAGHMVVSAHCPGQNGQVGIEHEHKGTEPMTAPQRDASAWLIAWISRHYKRARPLPLYPHSQFIATSCPANLKADLPELYRRASAYMKA